MGDKKKVQCNLTNTVTRGLGKTDVNGEVTLLKGLTCTVEYSLGLRQGDRNGEVTLLVRWP